MTAWQVASLPFWAAGFAFAIAGLCVGLCPTTTANSNERAGTAGIALVFAIPPLLLAPWMWS